MAIVTISREIGTSGEEVAARLAGRLGFLLINKKRIEELKSEYDMEEMETEALDELIPRTIDPRRVNIEASIRMIAALLIDLAEEFDLVIIGRGGQFLFRDCPGVFHLHLFASLDFRIKKIQEQYHINPEDARARIEESDRERSRYIKLLYNVDWKDLHLYDCVFRMDHWSIDEVVDVIARAVENLGLANIPKSKIIEKLTVNEKSTPLSEEFNPYANESEAEFANFLKFYGIPFQYEPRTFILEQDKEGRIIEAFTPDFYFPEQNLYIEITTLQQSLVTRKNRKIRKLRKLHPEVNIRVFYRRDFDQLLTKFGISKSREMNLNQKNGER